MNVDGVNDRGIPAEQILDTIGALTAKHGHAPTVRELARDLGLSVAGAHHRLVDLRAAGRVTWLERSPRTLRVTEQGE